MPTPVLETSAPAGVTITFRGKDIVINPTSLSGKTIKALRRRLCDMRRDEAKRLLAAKTLSPQTRTEIIERSLDVVSTGFGQVMKSIEIPEVLAEFLAIGIGVTYEKANELVEEFPQYDVLMMAAIQSMGLRELKNSDPPSQTGEPSDQAQDEPQQDQAISYV